MKILFISANRIGDAVLTTGILTYLQQTYPEARFTLVCGPVTRDLFRAVPRVDDLILLQKQKHHKHWLQLWKRCIGTRWDIVVDLRNSIVSRLLFAKKRYVKLAKPTGRHKLEDHASIFGLKDVPLPHLCIDEAAQAQADALVPAGAPILAIGPAANWAPKSWDIGNFIEVAKYVLNKPSILGIIPAQAGIQKNSNSSGLDPGLRRDDEHGKHLRLMVVAAPHERAQVQRLLDAFPKEQVIDVIGQDLLTVAACLQKASVFIGNDSGLMHIAAAMGVPTLGLFGPSDDRIYGPYGPRCLAVRTPETREQLFALQPYPGADTPLLMGTLTVEAVMEGIAKLMANR